MATAAVTVSNQVWSILPSSFKKISKTLLYDISLGNYYFHIYPGKWNSENNTYLWYLICRVLPTSDWIVLADHLQVILVKYPSVSHDILILTSI